MTRAPDAPLNKPESLCVAGTGFSGSHDPVKTGKLFTSTQNSGNRPFADVEDKSLSLTLRRNLKIL
jgi:hypothetical protein